MTTEQITDPITNDVKTNVELSHDAQIGAHLVLHKLKYDDNDAINSSYKVIASETGFKRWKQIFATSHTGEESSEWKNLTSGLTTIGIVSFVCGCGFSLQTFRDEFKYYNKLTKFESKVQAVRMMNDQVWLRSCAEGARWTVRLTFFSASFLGISQAISVYRNKSSPLDYTIAAGITGSLIKMNMGLRGMVAGGIIAGAFGLVGGLVIYGLQQALDETQDRRHFRDVYRKQLHEIRLERLKTQTSDEAS